MDCNHVTTNTCKNSPGTKKIRQYWQPLLGRRTVQVLRLFSSSAQRRWWQPRLVLLTLECTSSMWEGKMTSSKDETLWLQGDSSDSHPKRIWPTLPRSTEGETNTHPLDGWSSSHHLPVWSRIICQTPAAAGSVLLGTLVSVLQPAWRMWDVVARKTTATLLAQIIWGLFSLPPCESLCHARCVKRQPALGREKGGGGKKKEREKKEKKREKPGWQCWGSAFVTTQRDLRPDGSGPPPARSLPCRVSSVSERVTQEDFKGRFLERHHV